MTVLDLPETLNEITKHAANSLRRKIGPVHWSKDREDNWQIAHMASFMAIEKGLEGWHAKNSAAQTAFFLWINAYAQNRNVKMAYSGDIERHAPAQTVEDEEYAPIDERLLSPLSDRQRAVAEMILLDDVSYEEVAWRLGITTDNVHSALQKAKARIRKAVESMRDETEDVARAQRAADKARVADALDKMGESLADIAKILERLLNETRTKYNTKEISREK
jgi:RNA polymerase sigma factor (sigma-70 family)